MDSQLIELIFFAVLGLIALGIGLKVFRYFANNPAVLATVGFCGLLVSIYFYAAEVYPVILGFSIIASSLVMLVSLFVAIAKQKKC